MWSDLEKKLIFGKRDKILIVTIMACTILLLIPLFFNTPKSEVAIVSVGNEEVMRIDLSQDGEYVVQGTLGDVTISVKDGAVAVTQENSPHHYCSMQGYVSSSNVPIVCLPNETVVTIDSNEDNGEDALIQ
jgi:hypothetical protein